MRLKIIGWTFDAATHCQACTDKAQDDGRLTLVNEGKALVLRDRAGDAVAPIFAHTPGVFHCDECFVDLE